MGPATMTRGFMGLLSESQDHLNDTEVRVRGVRVSPSRVGEPDPLVEADGGLVAFGDLQFELLQRAEAGPVDDRTEERLPRAPPRPFGFTHMPPTWPVSGCSRSRSPKTSPNERPSSSARSMV